MISKLEFVQSYDTHKEDLDIYSYEFGAIQEKYHHEGWLPFAYDWGGNFIGLDLNLEDKDKWGRIINFGRDQRILYVVQPNFEGILNLLIEKLRLGICSLQKVGYNEYYLECFDDFLIENDYYRNSKIHPKILYLYENRD